MRINNILSAIALGVMAATGVSVGAHATVTMTGTYSTPIVAVMTNGNAPVINDLLSNPFTESLTLNKPTTTTNFFSVTPANSSGLAPCGGYHQPTCTPANDTVTGTITVTFQFTEPSGANGVVTDTGVYTADYSNDTDSVDWASADKPILVTFSDGATMDISLGNAQDWTIIPTITFTLLTDPTAAPEPMSVALLGVGLFGLGIIRQRRSSPTA